MDKTLRREGARQIVSAIVMIAQLAVIIDRWTQRGEDEKVRRNKALLAENQALLEEMLVTFTDNE